MKRIFTLIAAVMITSFVVVGLAQAHCGKCGKGSDKDGDWLEKKVTMMTEKLGLSEEQAAQVESLIKEKMEKKMAIKEEKRKAIQAVKDKYSGKIKAVLTDEQKAKYDEMKAEHEKGSMKGSDHEHKGSDGDMGENKGS